MPNSVVTMAKVYLWTLLVFVLFCTIFVDASTMNKVVDEERAMVYQTFGMSGAVEVIDRAHGIYNDLFVGSGALKSTYEAYIPTEESKRKDPSTANIGKGLFEYFQQRLNGLWTLVYAMTQRIVVALLWVPLFLPFIGACIYDGWSLRKVKMLSFEQLSPARFGGAQHAMLASCIWPIFYLLWPAPVYPMLVPLWLIVGGLALRMMACNLQRV